MENSELRLLTLVGITYNQIESGVYALILQETGGSRRIPIAIGSSEAQSIECRLQDITPPRPLTHDLMVSIMRAYGLSMRGIVIKRIDGGIFAADIMLAADDGREITVDSRSSDAIALAIRMGAPVYTTERVLAEAGVPPRNSTPSAAAGRASQPEAADLKPFSLEHLESMLAEAVENERYEEAARLKAEIDSRRTLSDNAGV